MYTGTATHDWQTSQARGAQAVQRAEAGMPWEQEAPRNAGDQEAWLLSFVDVLTLLLTLFVLLLAYHPDRSSAPTTPADVSIENIMPAMTEVAPTKSAPDSAAATVETGKDVRPIAAVVDELPPWSARMISDTVALPPDTIAIPAAPFTFAADAQPAAGDRARAHDHPLLQMSGTPWESVDAGPDASQAPQATSPAKAAAATSTNGAPEVPLQRLLDDLEHSALAGRVEVSVLPDAVNLEISDNILFAPASAALTPGGQTLLNDLASTLKSLPYALSVEGHTDNVPIRTARFPSNWELAAARASAVTRHLIERGVAADRVRAIGYADTRPRADNATPEGRARNRRVAFILRMPVP